MPRYAISFYYKSLKPWHFKNGWQFDPRDFAELIRIKIRNARIALVFCFILFAFIYPVFNDMYNARSSTDIIDWSIIGVQFSIMLFISLLFLLFTVVPEHMLNRRLGIKNKDFEAALKLMRRGLYAWNPDEARGNDFSETT